MKHPKVQTQTQSNLMTQLKTNYKEMFNNLSNTSVGDVNDKVMIVDGLNLFIRVFGAVPTLNDDGEHVGGVTGFLLSLGALIRNNKPTRVLIVFDGKGGSARRRKMHNGYKEGRTGLTKVNRLVGYEDLEDQAESMKRNFNSIIKYLQLLPVDVCYVDHVEADDIMAYAARHIFKKEVIIVSSDKDFLQLVDDRISVWQPTKKKMITKDNVHEIYGVPSHNLVYYRIFDGDKSDNIPGVSGVGPKTLINKLTFLQNEPIDSLDTLMERVNEIDDEKLKSKILANRSILELNYDLMQLSDPIMGSAITSNVRAIIDSPINGLNSFQFKKEFMVDKLYTAFKNVENWLVNTWAELDKYSKQTRK
jgi:DNA polymerase I